LRSEPESAPTFCPLRNPALLDLPKRTQLQRNLRNCEQHNAAVSIAVRRTMEPPGNQPTLRERFENAYTLLVTRGRRRIFTPEQEQAFGDKFLELMEAYEQENPGKDPPSLFYDKGGLLMVRWPAGWFDTAEWR
jgi:hypothetical protein